MKNKKIKLSQVEKQKVEIAVKRFIVDTVLKFDATGVVLGLSGGVDSTLAGIFAKKAFDEYNAINGTNLELKGYILPSEVNHSLDEIDAIKVANFLGIDYEIISIEPFVKVYDKNIKGIKNKQYNRGNLMSRIRANILHTKAALEGKLVCGTGNRDEDFGLGYYTLFGDGAVHLSPIGDLAKRQVKELVKEYGLPNIAIREPTAGLELGQTDFKDLGYTYETAELVVEGFNQGLSIEDLVRNSQIIDAFNVYINQSKFDSIKEVVNDVLVRHKIAKRKAELVSPPICQVEKRYI